MRKAGFGALYLGAALSLSAGTAWADCGSVSITEMNWESAAVVTSVSKFLMEHGYGCTVTVVPSSTVPAVTSVAETGEPDILTEIWINAVPAYKDLEAAGKVTTVANVLADGGIEGWYIPKYLAEAHPELETIEGVLAHGDWVGGKFHNCPEGWGCRVRWDNLIPLYGFDEAGIEVFNHGSGETLAASIASAHANQGPWFGYYWGPTSVLGKYPMVRVDRGPADEDAWDCAARPDCENVRKTGDVVTPVLTGVTASFAEREPEIVELMSNLSFSNEQMSTLLAWQEDTNASAEETAVYFLNNYKDVWGAWLNDSAREKLASLLQ